MEYFIIGFTKGIFEKDSFTYLCVSARVCVCVCVCKRCKCLRTLLGDGMRQLRGQSEKKTFGQGKTVMNRGEEERERGRRREKKRAGLLRFRQPHPEYHYHTSGQ